MNESREIEETDISTLFEDETNVLGATDVLMPQNDLIIPADDLNIASASDVLMSQDVDNLTQSDLNIPTDDINIASASDVLMSQNVDNLSDDVRNRKRIKQMEDLMNDNSVNLDETILYCIDEDEDIAGNGSPIRKSKRERKRPGYLLAYAE